jgi:putative ABC transport system substrate-binding protein
MQRREFIALLGGVAAACPFLAHAQQAAMPVIGFFGSTSSGPYITLVDAFRQGLKETGYVEGQNVAIEFRWADGQFDRLPALAAELVRRKVDVIVTSGSVPPALVAKAATSTIPIVFHIGADPVAVGLVASLNRPGGNVTGVSFLTYVSTPKRLGLLRDLIPALNVLGLLTHANDPVAESVVTELTAAVQPFGITLHVERAANESELDSAFAALAQRKVGAVIVVGDPFVRTQMNQVVALAARYGIPDMYSGRDYVVAGGLVGYGASIGDAYRQQGVYAGKILKGEKPADLPVMQSTKFELVINLRTAKALGLVLPSGMLSIADEVID